jgi:site-specific DNA-cytosine methylase
VKRGVDIECFSCSGGMAEGFRRAGVTFDFVFDKDPNAVESYTKNLSHAPIQMDVRDLMRMVRGGWSPGPVRLFVADPPCTPWSRAGKRQGLADERDMLRETADLIAALRPQFYLIGNVPGLQDSTSWGVVQDVIGGLSAHGYCVADYVSLDAADYGVPQHRVRPFWFGHLGGECIRWPAPTHGAPTDHPSLPGVDALAPWVTCRQALQHLPLEELGRPVRMKIRDAGEDGRKNGGDRSRCSKPDETARTVVAKADRKGGQILIPSARHPTALMDGLSPTIRGGGNGHSAPQVVLANDRHPPASPASPAPTIGSKDRGQSSVLFVGERVLSDRDRSATRDEPSPTITAAARGNQRLDVMEPGSNHPITRPDEPSFVIKTNGGRAAQASTMMEWPWDRPCTTVQRDERIAPPEEGALVPNRASDAPLFSARSGVRRG